MSFGNHNTFYASGKLFTQTSSNIAWIGSFHALLKFTIGWNHRCTLRAWPSAISPSGWNVLYRVGIDDALSLHCVLASFTRARSIRRYGIGRLFAPSFAIIQRCFSTSLSLAVGLAAAGGGAVEGIVYHIIFIIIIGKVGFGWTERIIGKVLRE
jgi:hypothetical protein